jgi:hypothetical protein
MTTVKTLETLMNEHDVARITGLSVTVSLGVRRGRIHHRHGERGAMRNCFRIALFILFASTAFRPCFAQGITIRQFDKMADARGEYIADLVQAAEQSLKNAGRPDDAAKISHLFTTKVPDGPGSIGVEQFSMTLAIARVADAKNPDAPPVKVVKVLSVCLEKNDGIKLPPEFMTMAGKLDPKYAQPEKKK